ncbi:MAG TPA: hypothetical protein DCY14_00065, partial [Anaerolineae bacterium]|nr:hypothetical protein [Anaerolineae bacterium]
PKTVDGLSLVSLFSGGTEWRDHILLEAWPDRGAWTAIHTGEYVYVETENDLSEFYDLNLDPFQLENAIREPQYQDLIATLKQYMEEEKVSTTSQP